MGLVCSSPSVWVLWATENIDRGVIWDWYVVVQVYGCCGQRKIILGGYMGLVCSSPRVWVLWATENIDEGIHRTECMYGQ